MATRTPGFDVELLALTKQTCQSLRYALEGADVHGSPNGQGKQNRDDPERQLLPCLVRLDVWRDSSERFGLGGNLGKRRSCDGRGCCGRGWFDGSPCIGICLRSLPSQGSFPLSRTLQKMFRNFGQRDPLLIVDLWRTRVRRFRRCMLRRFHRAATAA